MSTEPIIGRGKPSRSVVGGGPTPAHAVASASAASGQAARSPSPARPAAAAVGRLHAPPALTITSPGGAQQAHSPATPLSAGAPPSPALPRRPSSSFRSASPAPALPPAVHRRPSFTSPSSSAGEPSSSAAQRSPSPAPALPPAAHRRPSFTSPSSASEPSSSSATAAAAQRSPSPAPALPPATHRRPSFTSPTAAGGAAARSPSPAPASSPEMHAVASPGPPPALPTAVHRLSVTRATGGGAEPSTAASPSAVAASPAAAPAPPPPSPAVAAARAAAAAALLPAPVQALPPAPVVPVVPEVTSIDESIDPGKSAEERVTRYRLRRKVASEILATEQSYLASLNRMQDVYIKELLDPHHGLLTSAQGATLFSNIPVLIPLQQQFLDGMQTLLDKWTPHTQEMGDLFLKFAPFFKMYTQYVNNYDYATSLLTKLDKSEPFAALCRKLRATHGGLLDISSYLIQPIQRIPRYKLLISELLRYTNASHADFPKLSKAVELIADVALHINEAVRLQQNSQALLTLQERFIDGNTLQLIGPNGNGVPGPRRLILQGPLSKRGRRSDASYHFLLFSDFLLYAARSGQRLKLHRKIFINQFFSQSDVADIPLPKGSDPSAAGADANPNGDRFQLQILSAQKSFVVVAADAATKASWVAALSEAIADFKKAAEAAGHSGLQQADGATAATAAKSSSLAPPTPSQLPRRGSTPNISLTASQSAMLAAGPGASSSPSASDARGSEDFGTQQPVFQQFKSNSVCIVCAAKCSFSTGRHHCRNCGNIVCNNCSKERVYLSWTKQRSRACDRCCQKIKDERSLKIEKIQRLHAAQQPPPTASPPSTPQTAASLACPAVLLSPAAGGATPPPRPPRPAVPSRPHQDQLLKLLDELLETTPRMETAHATSLAEAKLRTTGAVATRAPSASVSVRPSSLGPPAVAALPADLKGALPVAKFSETKEAPKIVGQLPFVRARGGPGGKGGKQRSHSVMVGNLSPPSNSKSSSRSGSGSGSEQNPWENDGLSDSDDEANWDPQSTTTAPGRGAGASFSHHSVAEEDEGEDDEPHSGSSLSSLRSPVSVSRTSAVGAALHAAAPPPPTSARPKLMDSPAVSATRAWIGMVRVLYAFTAMDASQLSCAPGDLIALTSCSHDAWWRGEVVAADGSVSAKGLFPSAFVFDLRDNKASEAGAAAPGGDIYEAIGDYKVNTEGHLLLARGDLLVARQKHANGWWSMCHGATKVTGWVPSNYLASCAAAPGAASSSAGTGSAGSGSGAKFAPLTAAQEEKLNLVLSRAVSLAGPSPSASASAAAPATPSSYSQSPSRAATGGGGLLSTLKLRLGNSMTLGAKSPPPRSLSVSTASPSPSSSGSSAAGALMVGSPPPNRAGGGAGAGTPLVPSRGGPGTPGLGGRSNSVLSPSPAASASSSPPSQALPAITAERAAAKKSIMSTLKGFFASRPSKEALAKKGILKEAK